MNCHTSARQPLPALLLGAGHAGAAPPAADLHATLVALDSALLDSVNRCADPAQLARHAGCFAAAVEFCHDTGGVAFSGAVMPANTAAHACGKHRCERVPDTLQVHPLPGHGAPSLGEHRFCDTDGTRCQGRAAFTMVCQQHRSGWKLTRVLSYGHRSQQSPPEPRPAAWTLLQPPARTLDTCHAS